MSKLDIYWKFNLTYVENTFFQHGMKVMLQHLVLLRQSILRLWNQKKIKDNSDDEDEYDNSAEDKESSEDQEPGLLVNGDNESDDDTDSDEDDTEEESLYEDHETPYKAEPSKKRSAQLATKTSAPEKKAKLVTSQKTYGKKVSGHVATPHPSNCEGELRLQAWHDHHQPGP
ncbi:hypothetical protein REPUB_Repub20aG0109800 [Reevesia pubescens]